MKTALLIGSSGLVGSELLKQLLQSENYKKIILLNRKRYAHQDAKIEERLIHFDAPDLSGIVVQDVFCAIGTTLRKAGSKAVQFKIDCEYPLTLAKLLKAQGAEQFILVSSLGANPDSSNFYLRTKGQLEKGLKDLNYRSTVILRPSLLMGKRQEFRFGERLGILVMNIIAPLFLGPLRKYRGVQAKAVASRMIEAASRGNKGLLILESDKI
ncbi:MAG TPA: NAD-dependent epimerase/dehydratase family protein [Bacteroidia bacterium]|nr:NAD-dependent epimerase/dehydratase family protein [Bacteroidia bacterium]